MKHKTIKAVIGKKFNEWIESIKDEAVRELAKKNSFITGGCIASMLLREKVNDYDVYFTNDEEYTSGGPDVYLMVWFHANGLNPINGPGEGWSCASDAPTYVESCSAAGSVNVDGSTFHRFIGPNGPATVISYVPETRMDEWEFDLKDFIDDAVDQGVVSEAMYLQSIQAGFELVSGGSGLTVHGFYADVQ